jgi:hypothetical protein
MPALSKAFEKLDVAKTTAKLIPKGVSAILSHRMLGWSGRHRDYKSKVYSFEETAMAKRKTTPISHSEPPVAPVYNQTSGASVFARIFWILIGNAVLFFLALSIYQKHAALSLLDLFYWIIVVLLVVIRYCDIKYLGGLTGQGQPASIAHWRKYSKFLLLITAGAWLVVHALVFLSK